MNTENFVENNKNPIRILMTKMLRAEQIQKDLGYHFLCQNISLTLLLYERLNIVAYRMIQIIWTNIKLNEKFEDYSDCVENENFYIIMPTALYRVSQEERAKLREGVPYVKLYRYNPKHLYRKLNGYGDNGKRSLKLWQLLHILSILKLAGICGFCNVNICT